jgi:glutathione synthase/RimK-type ligase-like ATP-grasp enzyme
MPERLVVEALRESADARGLRFESFSHGWIVRLSHGDRVARVFGYDFELNSTTAAKIAGDKAATSTFLRDAGVPSVPHHLFLRSSLPEYTGPEGNWRRMLALAEDLGWDLVCKANSGTGGQHVYRVQTAAELETASTAVFAAHHSLALAPFVAADAEYRVILLDGDPLLVYEKVRDDGEWRHNLGLGGRAVDVTDDALSARLAGIAAPALTAIGLRFASVDLIATGSDVVVLEVNSGVMMEYYGGSSDERRRIAAAIYDRAVGAMFA